MTKFILILSLLFFSNMALASKILIEGSLDVFVDWEENEYESPKTFKVTIDEKKLPYKKSLGPAYLSISKSGVVNLGVSVGDADSTSESSLTLPKDEKGELIPLKNLILKTTGGEHAAGTWSFDSFVKINIKK